MITKSRTYKCPKCDTPVIFEATFESDEYGDRIELRVTCNHCKDTRYDSIDEMRYDFSNLVNKLGT